MKRSGQALAWLMIAALATRADAQETVGHREEAAPLAIRSGLEFLVEVQNEDGSWGGTKNATFTSSFANPATYRAWQVGASALATRALLEPGQADDHLAAAERGLDFLIANPDPVPSGSRCRCLMSKQSTPTLWLQDR